ncbi:hypothetical protein RHEC894_PC00120 (plasmid) [Rhizobium sp. CIAT894]|nr:hypothetical protein RHEC894_PC00120 [Rhizobium sp. CIAT894]
MSALSPTRFGFAPIIRRLLVAGTLDVMRVKLGPGYSGSGLGEDVAKYRTGAGSFEESCAT